MIKEKKKNPRSWWKNKASQAQEATVKMVNTIQSEYEGLLAPPFLAKKDDPVVPTIECFINQKVFHKTFYEMVDQSFWFPEGIAKDVIVQIQDPYVPADFMVLDMGVEDKETPIILGRPFLNTTNVVIYIGSGQVYFQFPDGKVHSYFNSYTNYE
jgi:hypothetical protein